MGGRRGPPPGRQVLPPPPPPAGTARPTPQHLSLQIPIPHAPYPQDSLSGPTVPLGLFGIAKTVIGYLASSIGARLDTEHPAARFALTAGFFIIHQGIVALTRRILLAQPEPWFNLHLFGAALLNGLAAIFLFVPLDRLRRPS